MMEKKVIQKTSEAALMSLAHEILRKRNRISDEEIHQKAQEIIALLAPKETNISPPVNEIKPAPTALEQALQEPVVEAEFKTVEDVFVDSLFEGNNTDYQRIMSMLNSKENAEEAQLFIKKQVQPDYDWSEKEKEVRAFIDYINSLYKA
ncbi:MAG: hypothetical protein P8H25_06390 [Flavobacteriaceae bacterium]|nr:hypothetical protein [Flavobacteriaceae bacterium]